MRGTESKCQIMNYLLSLLLLTVIGTAGMQAHAHAEKETGEPVFFQLEVTCPPGSDRARLIVENFLTQSGLSNARSETGTTGLTINEIEHLDDPDDTDVCEVLNSNFSNFDRDFRKVVYYQAGDYYFVSAPLIVPDTSEYSIIGPDFIIVLDSDFNTLGRYRGP